jgi:hypothetical protein
MDQERRDPQLPFAHSPHLFVLKLQTLLNFDQKPLCFVDDFTNLHSLDMFSPEEQVVRVSLHIKQESPRQTGIAL